LAHFNGGQEFLPWVTRGLKSRQTFVSCIDEP
jgi:hypothetical protein